MRKALADALYKLNSAVEAKPTDRIAKSVASVEKRLEAMLARFPTKEDVSLDHNILIPKEAAAIGLFGCCGFFACWQKASSHGLLGGGRLEVGLGGGQYPRRCCSPAACPFRRTSRSRSSWARSRQRRQGDRARTAAGFASSSSRCSRTQGAGRRQRPLATACASPTRARASSRCRAQVALLQHRMLFTTSSARASRDEGRRDAAVGDAVVAAIRHVDKAIIRDKAAVVPAALGEKDFAPFKASTSSSPTVPGPKYTSSASRRGSSPVLARTSPTGLAAN